MALTDTQLQRIEEFLLADASQSGVSALRSAFPGMPITRCDASDMQGEAPFKKLKLFDLYLLDTRDHCVRLTGDLASATGIVLAQRRGEKS
jgi:hypothetical protein